MTDAAAQNACAYYLLFEVDVADPTFDSVLPCLKVRSEEIKSADFHVSLVVIYTLTKNYVVRLIPFWGSFCSLSYLCCLFFRIRSQLSPTLKHSQDKEKL